MNLTHPFFPLKTPRDLRLFQYTADDVLVIACDSLGGIGPKPLDYVHVDGYTVGKFTARVALMETLSVGALPLCVADNLCVEYEPTGREILRGVCDEAILAGLDPESAVTGSTEKNISVEQTGLGVTVVGTCKKAALRIGVSKPNDVVIAIGDPSVGEEVVPAEAEGRICGVADVLKLLSVEGMHEVLPVGSEGLGHEIEVLSASSGLHFSPDFVKVDLAKSAGPATALLASISASKIDAVKQLFKNKPVRKLGALS
ncbi:MAG: hypothetical protein NWE92_04855 [Candidatus Bathyarchaeota archaeon]|nr:hypothetical protein [Candidatus Bathyarchaeota archaeon]